MAQLAALSGKQADEYLNARPKYPTIWYKVLAGRTSNHKVAWDVGTGNGQAAIGVAEYYEKVVATDINESQLQRAMKHPKVTYHHTPSSMSDDDLVTLLGGENSIDIIIAAQALHYFDLKRFYPIVKRVLRKQGGIIAVWVYNDLIITPKVDSIMKRLVDSTLPFRNPTMNLAFDGYRTIEFPFKNIRMGTQGRPKALDIPHKLSLNGFLGFLKSWQPLVKAKEQGEDLLTSCMIDEFKEAWGDDKQVKNVFYKAYMLAGKL
ncbi:S-adenosyl-L-methionine-dependent methyltransferase [Arabidopsis thaliana x Arabidopsis arenosa]|uniref:S-adenosyl-L-methionine-dependent methyltransferase n=1 Tax=Arabidopsis thaliana x Arabidopsis arenosa TaxID=1240361 RepID=A0A8T1ZQF6_9BRAS|nr:S-adenosyl-L-methionine-dependent methyltransferase [Arabidopsis thaliana x Arabidopsis arenosa]